VIKVWECIECGYEVETDRRPRECPECGADGDSFDLYEYDDEWDDEDEDEDDDGSY
jgi:hypothetical protein